MPTGMEKPVRRYADKPCQAVFEITNRCNFRCPHCASNSGRARPDELSTEEARAVIRELRRMGCERMTVLGGEFLLRADWPELCAEVKACGIALQLISNGVLIDDAVLDRIAELAPEVVAISMDGASRETYRATRGVDGFDHCYQTLLAMRRRGMPTACISTFSRRNLHDFDNFVPLFLDTGIVWQVQLADSAGERFDPADVLSDDDFEYFVDHALKVKHTLRGRLPLQLTDDFGYFPYERTAPEFAHWYGCPAGRGVIGIRANGDVLPCLSLGDAFVAENLRRVPLAEIWAHHPLFLRQREKARHLTGGCKACAMAERCMGGCTAMAITSTGEFGDNRYCIRRLEETRLLQTFS